MTMFKTKEQIEEMADMSYMAEYYNPNDLSMSNSSYNDGYFKGYTQAQQDIEEELKRLCTYNSTAIGKKAECYLKVMPTLVDIIDKHGIGVFLRGIVYRTYTQAEKDLLEACSEGFSQWEKGKREEYINRDFGKREMVEPLRASKEAWQAAKLSSMKELQEKDERIKELEEKLINKGLCHG